MIKKELQQELNRTKLVLDYARQEIKEKDKEIERLNKLEQLKNKKIYGSSKYEVVYFGEALGSDSNVKD